MALGSGNIDFRVRPLGQTRALIAMEVRQQHALDSADGGGPQISAAVDQQLLAPGLNAIDAAGVVAAE